MEAILALGIWPFIGLCAGTGAVAFFATRAITPAKMCRGIESTYGDWAKQEGRYKQFLPGAQRIVHVSRGAIGVNMRDNSKVFPTGVVIDEHGHKWEFHEIYLHGGGMLTFDREGDTANVYLVTTGQISGRWLKDQPTEFTDADRIPMPESPVKALQAQIEKLQGELEDARKEINARDARLVLLTQHHDNDVAHAEEQYQKTHGIIEDLRNQLSRLQEDYNNEVKSERALPLHSRIDFENQTRTVRKEREVQIGRGCGSFTDIEYYNEEVDLEPGDEGFIDLRNGVKFVRFRTRNVQEKIVAVPLEEDDFQYGKSPC